MKTWTIACPKDTKFLAGKFYRSYGKEYGVLLYQCSSLNIIEKGPMVAYGVETGHII